MSADIFTFAAKQARDAFQPTERTWEETEVLHRLGKTIYYAVVERYPHDAPLWESLSHDTKMLFIGTAEDITSDLKPERCSLCRVFIAEGQTLCSVCAGGAGA